jgi:hypothetical protein
MTRALLSSIWPLALARPGTLKAITALALALSTTTGCGAALDADSGSGDEVAGESDGEEAVAKIRQNVQFGAAGFYQLDAFDAKRSVSGMLFLPWSANALTTCGVTFVSKHRAITAAHCVPKNKAPIDQAAFFVQSFNADVLVQRLVAQDFSTSIKLLSSMTITGTFPSWNRGYTLTAEDGVRPEEPGLMACAVRVRCHALHGTERCPANLLSQDGGNGVDIALIECPGRAATRPWTTVSPTDETAGLAVEVHWTHEVVDLAIEPTDTVGPPGNFNNYSFYDPGAVGDAAKENNYHYRNAFFNQFLPLVSRSFPNGGAAYRASTLAFGDTERFTNLFGCHGTSGSGIFPQGVNRLLGPAVHGGGKWTKRLCTPKTLVAGDKNLSFVRPIFTRQIEQFALNDR